MFLGLRGDVHTCCYNKTYPIGKYPEASLHDIWFGEKRQIQAKALTAYDFSKGCHACKRIIEAGNYRGLPAKNYDHLPVNDAGYPTKIDFELSNECNLECVMCRGEFSSAIRRNREKLPRIEHPYKQELLSELEEFIPHLDNAHFLGGEPFLIPIYLDIWEMMQRINPSVRISVQTNATLLSNRVKRIIESMRFDIAVSIDSFHKENYEKIRQNGRFEDVERNIRYLRNLCEEKGTQFTFSYCPMPQNWHELADAVRYSNKLNCEIYFNKVDFPKECSFQSMAANELDTVIAGLGAENLPTDNRIEALNASAFADVIKQVEYWKEKQFGKPLVSGFEEYLMGLKNHISSKQLETSTFEDIRSKLLYIIDLAEVDRSEVEQKMMEVDYQTVVEGLKGVTREHAAQLFSAYMMPIEKGNNNA